MLPRVREPEVMDSEAEARDYDAMDHSTVNQVFVSDFLALGSSQESVLDVGTGTALIPIELCRVSPQARVVAVDLAEHMLALGRLNVARAGLSERIDLRLCDAKGLPFADAQFAAVVSNSIVHHIPEPRRVLGEMVRVCAPGGVLFVRDLLRPQDRATLQALVEQYAREANVHQRQMFADSLHAALTLAEVRLLVAEWGFAESTVQQTSDRHWTWSATKPG